MPNTRTRLVQNMNGILNLSGEVLPPLGPGDPRVIPKAPGGVVAADQGLPCFDGLDNDGDGRADIVLDPGCGSIITPKENPQCNDGIDNDMDGKVDLADMPDCEAPSDDTECGTGAAQAMAILPLLGYMARRKRRSRVA
jgi:hypothetical protein